MRREGYSRAVRGLRLAVGKWAMRHRRSREVRHGSHEGSGPGPGETRHGVRHIIATRDEVRPPAADQQGRWSLPSAKGIRGRLGVGGWRMGDAATGALDSALDAALFSGSNCIASAVPDPSWLPCRTSLERRCLIAHLPTANPQPPANTLRTPPCLPLDPALDPVLDPALLPFRPTEDGQPYLQSTEYGLRSAASSAESSAPVAASPIRQPPTPNRPRIPFALGRDQRP